MYAFSSVPQTIGGVLDRGFLLFKDSFSRCWALALVQSLAAAAPSFFQTLAEPADPGDPFALFRSPAFWTVALVGWLLTSALYAATMHRIHDVAAGRNSTILEAVGFGFRKVHVVAAASILFLMALFIGFVLLIIPGLYVAVAFIMFMPAIVVDDKGITESLSSSRRYVKGNFWRTSAVLSVVGTVLVIVNIVIGILVAIVAGPVVAMISGDPRAVLLTVQAVFVIVNVVASPLMAAMMLELYFDLKLRKEGTALDPALPT